MTEEEARPKCPICDETFDVDDVKTLEMHVEAHLATNLYCPVCNAAFGIDKRQDYQNHVQVNFIFFEKATKIDEIFTVDLTLCSKCQIDSEDFVNFCGL